MSSRGFSAATNELATATLICVPEEIKGTPHNLVVGIELPGSKPLIRTDVGREPVEEVELTWPEPMLDELAEFYDRTYVSRNNSKWNCHMFGAAVTGMQGQARYNRKAEVSNVVRGPKTTLAELESSTRYGIFSRLGYLAHTFVTAQQPDHCVQVNAYKAELFYSGTAVTVNHTYSRPLGTSIRPYAYKQRPRWMQTIADKVSAL